MPRGRAIGADDRSLIAVIVPKAITTTTAAAIRIARRRGVDSFVPFTGAFNHALVDQTPGAFEADSLFVPGFLRKGADILAGAARTAGAFDRM